MGPPMRGRGGRSYGPGYGPPPPPPGEYGAHAESPVVMVYGLDPLKMNADRVFNIFCLYGNVERVSTWEQKRNFGFCFVEVSQHLNTIQEVNVYFHSRSDHILSGSWPQIRIVVLSKSVSLSESCFVQFLISQLRHFTQVKFMKSKPGAAMVEMGDCYAVDRAITHLNNTFLFAQRMNVWWVLVLTAVYINPKC